MHENFESDKIKSTSKLLKYMKHHYHSYDEKKIISVYSYKSIELAFLSCRNAVL